MKRLHPKHRKKLLTDNRITLIVGLVAVVPLYMTWLDNRRALEQTSERVEVVEQAMGKRRGNVWRVADSLEMLRSQANKTAPRRSKISDGTVGDAAHASRTSDHNPWVRDGAVGVVTALDLTHDPKRGFDCQKVADRLVASRDPRIKYIIWNYRIVSSTPAKGKPAWTWRRYTGANPHDKHIHVSVKPQKAYYDYSRSWTIESTPATPKPTATPVPAPVVTKMVPAKILVKSPRLIVVVPKTSGDVFVNIPSAFYTSQKFFTVNQSDLAGRAFRKAAPSVRVSLRTALTQLGYDVDHGSDKTSDKNDPKYYIWVKRSAPVQQTTPVQPSPVAQPTPQPEPQSGGLLSFLGRIWKRDL